MNQRAIEVRGLTKTYPGGVEAVKAIEFDAHAGEVVGLLGPNGAGKSTTIGMLTTTILPTAGTARLAGFDVVTDPIAARSVNSVVFQEQVLDRTLTGRRNLEIHARLWGVDPDATVAAIGEWCERFGLTTLVDRPVSGYSGGERRRLEIARALLSAPQVLFLDEPTVGLDPRIRFELLDLIAGLRERGGMTIMLTTHYLDEAERLCDRGDAATTLGRMRANSIAGADAFSVGSTITIPLHEVPGPVIVAAIDGLDVSIESIATRAPTLDDVYLR